MVSSRILSDINKRYPGWKKAFFFVIIFLILLNQYIRQPISPIAAVKDIVHGLRTVGKEFKVMTVFGTSVKVGDTTRRAGLFTPYSITPGGGEKYFLTVALAFQSMGYDVDILVGTNNHCDEIGKLQYTAAALRVPLDFNRLRLVQIFSHSDAPNDALDLLVYESFFTIANSKIHEFSPRGTKYNVWMCQFPFDGRIAPGPTHIAAYLGYDVVLVNSMYSEFWYNFYMGKWMKDMQTRRQPFPSVEILYPPVTGYEFVPGTAMRSYAPDAVINIVVLGRFFRGRQSKGHDVALLVLENVLKHSNRTFHLSLLGNIHPTEESYQYVQELQNNATSKQLPVTFTTNASPEQITSALASATIFWHLTGMKQDENSEDPASKEHFGIAIAEAMSAGCIPIVTAVGGPTDIVNSGFNGFLATSPEEFTQFTVDIAKSSEAHLREISSRAVERSQDFSVQNFVSRFALLAHRSMTSRRYRKFAHDKLPLFRKSGRNATSKRRKFSAVIFQTGIDPIFEFTARNIIHFLGPSWALQVVHSERNEKYVRTTLKGLKNVHFRKLEPKQLDYTDYNKHLKSPNFWRALKAEKVILVRPDALMLRDGIYKFVKYDMIGMMSANDNFLIGNNLYTLPDIAKNTGFSLRSTAAMIAISEKYGHLSKISEPEDKFFARYMSEMGYRIASADEARTFCPEVQVGNRTTWTAADPPLALHAPWYYTSDEVMDAFFRGVWSIDRYKSEATPRTKSISEQKKEFQEKWSKDLDSTS